MFYRWEEFPNTDDQTKHCLTGALSIESEQKQIQSKVFISVPMHWKNEDYTDGGTKRGRITALLTDQKLSLP